MSVMGTTFEQGSMQLTVTDFWQKTSFVVAVDKYRGLAFSLSLQCHSELILASCAAKLHRHQRVEHLAISLPVC